jgi:integrase
MKAGKEHRAPLSAPALAILEEMQAIRDGDFVFPGIKPKRSLSDMAMAMTLRRMGRGEITVHGFRSTFRDWAAERTNFPSGKDQEVEVITAQGECPRRYR